MTDRLPTIREFHADPNATPIARGEFIAPERGIALLRGRVRASRRNRVSAVSGANRS